MTAVHANTHQAPVRTAKTATVFDFHQARNKQAIKRAAEEREIPFLVHFTQVENLPGILQHGIISREHAAMLNTELHVTDLHRFDNRLDAVSLSIAFPNSPMFYRKRQDFPACNWVVLLLESRILWEKDCAFYHTNAASNQMRYVTERSLRSERALRGMVYQCASRDHQGLQPYDPTDVQAEVMVCDVIEPEYIGAAVFQDHKMMNACNDLFADMDVQLGVQALDLFERRECARR